MRQKTAFALAAVLSFGLIAAAPGADAPTTKALPRTIVAPTGFAEEPINGVRLMVDKSDAAWVRDAAKAFKPATQPATRPSAVADNIKSQRAKLIAGLTTDLGLANDRDATTFVDGELIPAVQVVESGQPQFVYMPITQEKLKDLVKGGWTGFAGGSPDQKPVFYYNRFADSVEYNPSFNWDIKDQIIVPLFYDPKEEADKRTKLLTDRLVSAEAGREQQMIARGRQLVITSLLRFIDEKGIKPLNLNRQQQWLGLGTQSYLVSKHAAPLVYVPFEGMLQIYMSPQQRLFDPRGIDLTQPVDEKILREDMHPLYESAMRNKATAVMYMAWLKEKGDSTLPKVLIAVRSQKPADSAALLKIVKETAGVDLEDKLK